MGIVCLAGAELFVKKNFSLYAEYFALLHYQSQKYTVDYRYDGLQPDKTQIFKTVSYNMKGSNVYFGLSVYF